jgi:hypothetical protein
MASFDFVRSYQIRLYRADGATSLVYDFLGLDDDQARAFLDVIDDDGFDHFEIWRGMELIADGGGHLLH